MERKKPWLLYARIGSEVRLMKHLSKYLLKLFYNHLQTDSVV